MAAQKSRGGNRRRRAAKAPVLELDATEIVEETADPAPEEQAASEPKKPLAEDKTEEPDERSAEANEPDKPDQPKRGRGKLIATGIAGLLLTGAGGGAWLYKDIWPKYFPSATQEGQANRIAALESTIAELKSSSTKMSDSLTNLTAKLEELRKTNSGSANDAENIAKEAKKQAVEALSAIAKVQKVAKSGSTAAAAADKNASNALAGIDRNKQDLLKIFGNIKELKSAIDAAAASVPTEIAEAGDAMKAAQAQISSLALKVAELENRASDPEVGSRLDQLDTALSSLQIKFSEPSHPDPQLSKKVDSLSEALKAARADMDAALKAQKAEIQAAAKRAGTQSANQQALTSSLTQLRAAAQSGKGFQGPLAALQSQLKTDPLLQALTPYAAKGVPTAAALISRFAKIAPALESSLVTAEPAKTANEAPSFMVTLQNRLGVFVKVRPSGAEDWGKIARRMSRHGESGNLEGMINLAGSAKEAPPDVLAPWLKEARARIELDKAIDDLSVRVMSELTKPTGTGG